MIHLTIFKKFATSCISFVISSAVIPNRCSFFAHLVTLGSQFLSVSLNIATSTLVFLSKEPFITYSDNTAKAKQYPLDFTIYIRIVSALSLIVSLSAL